MLACLAGAIVNSMMPNTELPFVLDDVGCNGTETNLLECLPQHNCQPKETAGVRCLLKGILAGSLAVG